MRQAVPDSKPVRAAIVFRQLSGTSRVLDVLLRYGTAFDRQFSRALNLLIKLRANQPAAEPVAKEDQTAPAAPEEHAEPAAFPNPPTR